MRTPNHIRRALLQSLCLTAGLVLTGGLTGCVTAAPTTITARGLRDYAAARGKFFGAAVEPSHLRDTEFATALAQQVNMLVPENALKWRVTQPQENQFDFSGYDSIARFARTHNMKLRGHALVWHRANPSWLTDILQTQPQRAEDLLAAHITTTLKHTRGTITDWDVVNEAIHPKSNRPDALRVASPWLKALGPYYIPLSFQLAHAADPHLTLTYNDYNLEYADGGSQRWRDGVLRLLTWMKRNNVPVHQLGLQSHLQPHRPLGGQAFVNFLRDVRTLGVRVAVTELDMKLDKVAGDDVQKMQAGADYTARYIDLIQQAVPLDTVLCWGLSSRYSFMIKNNPAALAPLPLDAAMQPLPLWHTLRKDWLKA